MKRFLILLLPLFIFISANAQQYDKLLKDGDAQFTKKEFKKALDNYWAAQSTEDCKNDESKQKILNTKIQKVFESILALKKIAEDAKVDAQYQRDIARDSAAEAQRQRIIAKQNADEAEHQRDIAKDSAGSAKQQRDIATANAAEAEHQKIIAVNAKEVATVALAKAQKLIDAFYFYDDKFALAYGPSKVDKGNKSFYYIDKNGNRVDRLSESIKAEQFSPTSFAKVTRADQFNSQHDYLLDTLGYVFPVAYNLKDIDSTKTAVELYPKPEDSLLLPSTILNKKLQVLILNTKNNTGQQYWMDKGNVKNLLLTISGLTSLEYFNMSESYIFELPDQIAQLSNLENLVLEGNRLSGLPLSIGDLKNLRELDLYNNTLSNIPEQIGNLSNLMVLNLRANKLNSLPLTISSLKNLTVLNLRSNKLESLPAAMAELTGLKELDLSNNNLNGLPASVNSLINLTNLDISSTRLDSLPSSIKSLTKLTRLDLSGNQLKTVPAEIGQLTALTRLDLSDNQLEVLPVEIGQLTKLTSLDLSTNKFKTLPAGIELLTKLQSLGLYGNNAIPKAEIERLKALLPGCKIDF